MSNHITSVLLKHKQVLVLTVVSLALALYIFPLDSLFSNENTAAAQSGKSADSRYGKSKQGPPSSTPGGVPGERSQGNGPPETTGPPAPRSNR
jgi:hypothetical protein